MPSDEIVPSPQMAPQMAPEAPPAAWTADPDAEAMTPALDGARRMIGKLALISGGDGAVGSAVAIAFALAGADVAILYGDGHETAQATMHRIVDAGRETMALAGDVGLSAFCDDAVSEVVKRFGRIDILVNAAAAPHDPADFAALSDASLERTFRTNVLGAFYLTRAALPHLQQGAAIVNTATSSAVEGHAPPVDEAASQAAVLGFTRSLSLALATRGVRVNAVAVGPACPAEAVAPSYVFLASDDATCMTGQILHATGGPIIGP